MICRPQLALWLGCIQRVAYVLKCVYMCPRQGVLSDYVAISQLLYWLFCTGNSQLLHLFWSMELKYVHGRLYKIRIVYKNLTSTQPTPNNLTILITHYSLPKVLLVFEVIILLPSLLRPSSYRESY
jgi:hypothetical protein